MNRNVAIGIALAVVVVVILTAVVLLWWPTKPAEQQTAAKMYIYDTSLAGQTFSTMYIPLRDGVVYGTSIDNSATYLYLRENLVNVLSTGPQGEVRRATYYVTLMELCINSTQTVTIAGERVTLADRQCSPTALNIPTVKTFDEVVLVVEGLPGPTSPKHWSKAGAAETPYGRATVYTNTTTMPIMVGFNAVFNYEKQVLDDGTVYKFRVSVSYGGQTAGTLTFVLARVQDITPEVRQVIDELSKNVSATPGGGLDVLRVASKIGMNFGGGWPAAVVFFDLQCLYCAMLFHYNYTLFEGHKLVLVDLVVHQEALRDHQRLRCLYRKSPGEFIPKLREIYTKFLGGDANATAELPAEECPLDTNSARQLATALVGQNVGTPMVVVVYPNGTFTTIVGYNPGDIAKALGK